MTTGALAGLRVLEFAGIGPAPFCAMLLADHGADVVRIERPGGDANGVPLGPHDQLLRGRQRVVADLKSVVARVAILRAVEAADVLIEGFRPGVMERLGFGPDACLALNGRLIYGRMTGWGQHGPLAPAAGHDINYIALAGVLAATGPAERPVPPVNLVADFGGGAMMLAFGILAALQARARTGAGQVVDAAMVDGAALLNAMTLSMRNAGIWSDAREANLLDGGAPFYRTYAAADGRWLAVGALEPRFFRNLCEALGLDDVEGRVAAQMDRARWPELAATLAAAFATRSRDAWVAHFDGREACVTPVLTPDEAAVDPHMAARGVLRRESDGWHASAAPRLSATPAAGRPIEGATLRLEALAERWR